MHARPVIYRPTAAVSCKSRVIRLTLLTRAFLVHRFTITISLLIALLSNSAWIIGCQTGVSLNSALAATEDAKVPDCCRDGMCPYHHHHHAPPRQPDDDCTCHLSSDSTLIGTAQIPAIDPESCVVAEILSPLDRATQSVISFRVSPKQPVLTPPPKA